MRYTLLTSFEVYIVALLQTWNKVLFVLSFYSQDMGICKCAFWAKNSYLWWLLWFGLVWFDHFGFLRFANASSVQTDTLLSASPCPWSMGGGLTSQGNLRTFSILSWTPLGSLLQFIEIPPGRAHAGQPAIALHFMVRASFLCVQRGTLDCNINPIQISMTLLTQTIGIAMNSLSEEGW